MKNEDGLEILENMVAHYGLSINDTVWFDPTPENLERERLADLDEARHQANPETGMW